MKNRKHIFIPLFIFLGAALVSLIYSIIDYKVVNPTLASATANIQFNFDGASSGVDPDGNPFNPIGLLTDDVIESAAQKCELNYNADDVRPYLSMENIVPKNILKEISSYQKTLGTDEKDESNVRPITSKDYHPVRFKFTLYHGVDKKLSKDGLKNFLKTIVEEYCSSFYASYKKSFTEDTYKDLLEVDNYDYIYQSEIYVTRLRVLMNYASTLYNEHPEFIVGSDNPKIHGKSFNDLVLIAEQLINSDSTKANNIIILNALSKDVDRLKDYYTYLLETLNYDKVKYTADYNAITQQITGDPTDPNDDYKINPTVYVGTGENVIQVQDGTAATYNSLLNQQISLANTLTGIDKQIADYQDILDKLNAASTDADALTTVQRIIAKLGSEYQELDDIFQVMVDLYNQKYVLGRNVVKSKLAYNNASLFSGSFIVHTIKVAAPIMLTVMFGISIFYLVWVIRKEKEKKAA